ncbi:MAG: ATP-binding protein [Gammaproteobacteria bacterium HGW-Gammaproteobacteria-6]|nr:MAG: ATP-binding protein [Gammaproteobacteria bacterium HGW-Gammaproteobacteria-6]
MKSIGRQLGLGLLSTLLIAVIVVGQGSVWVFDQAFRRYFTSVLQSETDSLLAALQQGNSGLYLDKLRLDPDYQRLFSGRYFVIDADQRWRSRSLWDHRLPLDAEGLHNTLVSGPNKQQLLVWSSQYVVHDQPVRISVAINYLPLLESFERARWWIWGLGLGVIFFSLLLQQFLLRRALLPLRGVKSELAEWHVGQRLQLTETVPEELQPLVHEINHLGRQVEQVILRSRAAQADLGHALKTPLAVVESLLDQAAATLDAAHYSAIKAQLMLIRQLLERVLQRSRLAPESLSGKRFDPREDLPWLLESLHSLYADKSLDIEILVNESERVRWPFERQDMLEMLGNLLDNACKWAESKVTLAFRIEKRGLHLSICDDGPGVPEAERQRVLRRGQRLDQSVTGQGLGLAIVTDLVDTYGGQIELSQSGLGGLQVEVYLPSDQGSVDIHQ